MDSIEIGPEPQYEEWSGLYQTVTELSPDAIAVHMDGVVIFTNPATIELFRAESPDQIIGRPVLDFVHPDDRPLVIERVRAMRETGRAAATVEERFLTADGTEIVGEVAASPILYHGKPAILVVIRDVTERKRADEERKLRLAEAQAARLAAEEAQRHLAVLAEDNARLYSASAHTAAELEAILSQLTDGVILCDPTGEVTFMNQAACTLYGNDFTGRSLMDYTLNTSVRDMQGAPYDYSSLPLARALSEGERTIGAEARLRRPDGTEISVQRSATPVRAEDGTLLGAVLTMHDTTAERDLDRQKDEFLSLVAHEIRTPLTVIQGFVQLLDREPEADGEATRRRAQTVARQVRQLNALVGDLIDISRLQAGRLTFDLHPVNYSELVAAVTSEMQELHSDRPVQFSVAPDTWLEGDRVRLQQVLVNLIQNAVAYGPPETEITLNVTIEGDLVTTTVCDRGPALPMEEREPLFDRFHRLARHRSIRPGGLGMGLSISRAIVEAHGGRIWIPDSDYSCFAFSLPIKVDTATPPTP